MKTAHNTLAGAGFFRPHWQTLVSIAPADPAPAARKAMRADWLACPWAPAAPDSFGVPTGAELRAQRKRQAEEAKEEAAGASGELRAELRARLAQASRLGWNRPATNCQIRAEVRKFSAVLARRLCDGTSMRGRAHVRTKAEGYRRKASVPKYWGDFRAQVAAEIESELWHSLGLRVAAGLGSGMRPARAILRAMRSRLVVVSALKAGESILRRMSHRSEGDDLTARADDGAPAGRWQPAPEQVARLREAIRAGARNAPTAARMLALLDSILAGRPPAGANAARTVGRMLACAEAGGFSAPSSWRAYCGARVGGRPAIVTA